MLDSAAGHNLAAAAAATASVADVSETLIESTEQTADVRKLSRRNYTGIVGRTVGQLSASQLLRLRRITYLDLVRKRS